jgi:hypothetical protein
MMMMKKFRYRMSVGVVGLAILASAGCTSSKTSDDSVADLAPAGEAGTDAVPMDPAAAPPTADAAAPGTNVAGTDAPPPTAPAADEKTAAALPDLNPTTAPPVGDVVASADKTSADKAPSNKAPAEKKAPAKHHKKHKAAKKSPDLGAAPSESLSDAQADASAAAPKEDLNTPPAETPPGEANPLMAANDVHPDTPPPSTPPGNTMGNQAMNTATNPAMNPGMNPTGNNPLSAQNGAISPPPVQAAPPPVQRTVVPPPPPPAEMEEPFYMKKSVMIATVILAIAGAGSFMFRRKES